MSKTNLLGAARGVLLLVGLLASFAPRAEDPARVEVTIRDHRFVPSEIRVPAARPVVLEITNEDPTAEEFDSRALKVEKVIAGGKSGTVRIRALEKGTYPFMGEYHQETARGTVVAE
ncbi:MAG TPA: cupredoxin domain-containing protein [Anaeromyxobacter sp.]|nr:cupredoxin domain-containing protein [Anaeromyxobacter sp.]